MESVRRQEMWSVYVPIKNRTLSPKLGQSCPQNWDGSQFPVPKIGTPCSQNWDGLAGFRALPVPKIGTSLLTTYRRHAESAASLAAAARNHDEK